MMQNTIEPLYWTDLSITQKKQGIHPDNLTRLRFNLSRRDLTEERLTEIKKFFLRCSLAAPEDIFLDRITNVINSLDSSLESIRTIANKVFHIPRPEEPHFTMKHSPFKAEDTPLTYYSRFINTYETLIKESSFLLHPTRRDELIEIVRTQYENPELTAERLIIYRCYGATALKVSEQQRIHRQLDDQYKKLVTQMSELTEIESSAMEDLHLKIFCESLIERVSLSYLENEYQEEKFKNAKRHRTNKE